MKKSLGKNEKLKSKKEIEHLFSKGKTLSHYPIKLLYTINSCEETSSLKATVSVGKRNFKKAVDRNRIKRLLREVYRQYKPQHPLEHKQISLMILYVGKEMPSYESLSSTLPKILKKLARLELQRA